MRQHDSHPLTTPPRTLRLLFPELPDWAVAPFLGEAYVPLPPPTSEGRWYAAAGQFHEAYWQCCVLPQSDAALVAVWWYNGRTSLFPFGANRAEIRPTAHLPRARTRWSPVATEKDRVLDHRGEDTRDLAKRWARIADPTARQEILGFWLGHELPQLADLGLALLNPAARLRV
jgi:hypothetical protein